MLRIEIKDKFPAAATIRLFGTLTKESVPTLEIIVRRMRTQAAAVTIDLALITTIDVEAFTFLQKAKSQGVEIIRTHAFNRASVRSS